MRNITLDEYVSLAKRELDEWAARYHAEHAADPKHFPLSMPEGDWGDQELAERFT